MLDGLTISNGLGWSLDGRTMYLADSTPGTVQAFDFDGERGTISNARVLIQLGEAEGMPDGLTVDAAGDLWVAVWAGERPSLRPGRVAPGGASVPAVETTSCGFAGRAFIGCT